MRHGVSHQFGLVGLRRQQNQFGQALDDHRSQFGEIGAAALDALVDKFVDFAVQAVGHLASSASRTSIAAPATDEYPGSSLCLRGACTWWVSEPSASNPAIWR